MFLRVRARLPWLVLASLASLALAVDGCRGDEHAPWATPGPDPDRPSDDVHDVADASVAETLDAHANPDSAREPTTCAGICNAATPRDPVIEGDGARGNVTMYTTEASSGGACNYGETRVSYFAAVNVNQAANDGRGQWQHGSICGQCVEVTLLTSQGPASVVVRIMDKCPDGFCGLDLGGVAPAAVMRNGFGRYDGTWRLVSCAGHPEVFDGPTSLFVLGGANAFWSRVQVRNPPAAVDGLTWTDDRGETGTWPYAADPENTFEVPTAVLQSSAKTLAVSAHFRDGSVAAVELAPRELARGSSSFPLR